MYSKEVIMRNIILAALAIAATVVPASGKYSASGVRVNDVKVSPAESGLYVGFGVDMRDVNIRPNEEWTVTPVLRNGDKELRLRQVTFAGRNRWYNHLRREGESEWMLRSGENAYKEYLVNIPFEPWMNNAEFDLEYEVDGCCGKPRDVEVPMKPIARLMLERQKYEADFLYVPPVAEGVKTRSESGSAFIDFPVNVMTINPDYRNNPRELAKIIETIDKVKNDKDITITGLAIRGYASPEGSYSNNERLAKGRTASLKDFVQNLYSFPKYFIATSYDPEDWCGLRKYVEDSDLADKEAILQLINSKMDPDAKDQKLKRDFPEQYKFLLTKVYPALRHSDYTVNYTVRTFTDPAEILMIMKTAPGKLNLEELFVAANSLEPGSDEYNEVFEVAVRLFPDDRIANLNAANAAMGRKDYKTAEKYLQKAGDDAEAQYVRGVLKALEEDYDGAESFFRAAGSLPAALSALETIARLKSQPEAGFILFE